MIRLIIIISTSLILILTSFHLLIKTFLGNINYTSSFDTRYKDSKIKDCQIIGNRGFEIETPKIWLHIAYQPDCPGYIGDFWTSQGLISYEYGMFAPSFGDKPKNQYEITDKQINNLKIKIIREKSNNHLGIYIPRQRNMKFGMIFYPSKACSKNINQLLESLNSISFKEN